MQLVNRKNKAKTYVDRVALIENNVERIPFSGCWIWKRSLIGKGYGQAFVENRKGDYAHRIAYRAFKGEIPSGFFVCHTCDVPSCCNPNHLFLGTPRDNTRDCMKKGRLRPGRTGGTKKLKLEQINKIKALRATGMLQKEIGAMFGVSQVRVSQLTKQSS